MIIDVNKDYMKWIMYDILKDETYDSYLYDNLFYVLHFTKFIPYTGMDTNRIGDAKNLRYRYGAEKKIPDAIIKSHLCIFEPSVLEVLVALSLRVYEDTTSGFPIPIEPHEIFWTMMKNLKLTDQTNDEFDQIHVEHIINRMMNHDIEKNGLGGPFIISNDKYDMRTAELWYQAQWWATEVWRSMEHLV